MIMSPMLESVFRRSISSQLTSYRKMAALWKLNLISHLKIRHWKVHLKVHPLQVSDLSLEWTRSADFQLTLLSTQLQVSHDE